jgi:chemotaxis protein MotB
MRRKRKDDEQENLDRWLITYSDLITLLLAFFIMMYTFSKQDAQRYQEVTEQLKVIFTGGASILKTGRSPDSKAVIVLPSTSTSGISNIEKQLEKEVKSLAEALDSEHKISVFHDERGIVIRVMDRAFFDEGRAVLKETAKQALAKIAPIIESSESPIRIEGHTDNVPIKTAEFGSNWELSVRRATEVVRHLIEKYNFPAERISASGYAEYRPVAPNDTAENRALNRRIEIILLQPSPGEPAAKPSVPGPAKVEPTKSPKTEPANTSSTESTKTSPSAERAKPLPAENPKPRTSDAATSQPSPVPQKRLPTTPALVQPPL